MSLWFLSISALNINQFINLKLNKNMKTLKLEHSEGNGDYEINNVKFDEISQEFPLIPNTSFYATNLKIAVNEYAEYVNKNSPKKEIFINGKDSFLTKIAPTKFVVNNKLVQKSIKNANKKNIFRTFHWMKFNIVLDKLRISLASRN